MGTNEITSDWPGFLAAERIKGGIAEIAFALIVFAALLDSVRREENKSGSFFLTC